MRWFGLAATGALVACSASSNGGTCPPTGSLEISLADADSAVRICDAGLTLAPAGGGAAASLMAEGGKGAGCYYFLAVAPGQYTLVATKMGYETLSQNFTVTTDGCTIESPTLALELLPAM
jgi:hypothetical protein